MGLLLCPVAVLLAATAPAAKAPPEAKSIDATCDAATKLDAAHKLNPRILADLSDAVLPEANDGTGKWRVFKNDAALKAYSAKKNAPNTQVWTWNAPDGTTIALMYFQSDSGDWNDEVTYCFRPDGTLARADAILLNVSAEVSGNRVTYFARDGHVLFKHEEATEDEKPTTMEALDATLVYPTVKSLPFLAPPGSTPPPTKSPPPDGSLDQTGATHFVVTHAAEVRSCYDREAAKHPGLAGLLQPHWTIEPDGSTSHFYWEQDTVHSPAVATCVEQVIGRWRFEPKPHEPLKTSFPFELHPRSQPDAGAGADGGLDPASVARYVREHLGAVKGCYERELKKNATLSGKVVMHWTIDRTGATRGIDVQENTLATGDVGACLQGLISKWQFTPPSGGSVDVAFPFVFQATPGKKAAGAGGKRK